MLTIILAILGNIILVIYFVPAAWWLVLAMVPIMALLFALGLGIVSRRIAAVDRRLAVRKAAPLRGWLRSLRR